MSEEYEDACCRVRKDEATILLYEEELDAEAETVEGEKEVGHAGMKWKAESDRPELKPHVWPLWVSPRSRL